MPSGVAPALKKAAQRILKAGGRDMNNLAKIPGCRDLTEEVLMLAVDAVKKAAPGESGRSQKALLIGDVMGLPAKLETTHRRRTKTATKSTCT